MASGCWRISPPCAGGGRTGGWPPTAREGVRISLNRGGGEGWFLLRLSVHDPVMPLNIESDAPGGCRLIAQELAPFLHGYDGLDCGAFDSYLAQAR